MFVQLAASLVPTAGGAQQAANLVLTNWRASQIVDFLEEYWRQGVASPAMNLGATIPVPDHQEHGREAATNQIDPSALANPNLGVDPIGWYHLVYAYMLENTRIMDIFRRVVYEYAHGERLPQPTQETQFWLRTTEELFFTTPRYLSVRSVTSNLRPDSEAVRRNLYFRVLGMDLIHGAEDGRPYPFVRAEAANRDFTTLFEALLTEVWKGFVNVPNIASENTTDNAAIATLVRRLQEMLTARRANGMLSREEFDAVATLSWFHLTVVENTQIVTDLGAQSTGVADRLKRIGQLVGIGPHSRSDAYFQLAQPVSLILRAIENGAIAAAGPASLYNGAYTNAMQTIIANWSIAKGSDLKNPVQRQPLNNVLVEAIRRGDNRWQRQANSRSFIGVT